MTAKTHELTFNGGLLERGGLYEAIAKSVRENGEVFGAYRSLGQGGIPFNVLEALLGKKAAVVDTPCPPSAGLAWGRPSPGSCTVRPH